MGSVSPGERRPGAGATGAGGANGRGTGPATADAIVAAVREANLAIFEASRADAAHRGMGTTVTALAVLTTPDGERLALANVGDSRAYALRKGRLVQLSVSNTSPPARQGQCAQAEGPRGGVGGLARRAPHDDRAVRMFEDVAARRRASPGPSPLLFTYFRKRGDLPARGVCPRVADTLSFTSFRNLVGAGRL